MNLPSHLYHGSAYLHTELKPGFLHSGIEVQWDVNESNRFLYATTDKNTAIELGFASSIEKAFNLHAFQSKDNDIKIVLDEVKSLPRLEDLFHLPVYLYTLRPRSLDHWVPNHNAHNGLTTEWKTQATIRTFLSREQVDVKAWCVEQRKTLHIQSHAPSFTRWTR